MLTLNEVQKITLRDILTTAGLTTRQVEDIFLLLRFKPERVQLAFYYRACGNTHREIGKIIGVSHVMVQNYIKNSCDDIAHYIGYEIASEEYNKPGKYKFSWED